MSVSQEHNRSFYRSNVTERDHIEATLVELESFFKYFESVTSFRSIINFLYHYGYLLAKQQRGKTYQGEERARFDAMQACAASLDERRQYTEVIEKFSQEISALFALRSKWQSQDSGNFATRVFKILLQTKLLSLTLMLGDLLTLYAEQAFAISYSTESKQYHINDINIDKATMLNRWCAVITETQKDRIMIDPSV